MLTVLGPLWRMMAHLRPEQLAWRAWARLRAPWHRSPFYAEWVLDRGDPPPFLTFPPPVRAGDPDEGRRILRGAIRLINQEHPFKPPLDWRPAGTSHLWRFHLHYFDWLDHLAALATPAAAGVARAAIGDWIARHPRPDDLAWHPYPLSLRLHAWLRHAPWLGDGAPEDFAPRLSMSLLRQARHLAATMERDVGGNHLIKNLKARIAAAACLDTPELALAPPLAELERELRAQILADGTHYERSPAYHFQVLGDLIDLRDLLAGQAPSWLADAARRMAGPLRLMRHGDGRLALFNDGEEGDAAALDAVLDRITGDSAMPAQLPDAGLYRLWAGETVVLADAGRCCPDDLPAHAHADALAFEMSVGAERIVVNCGTYAYQDATWRNRLRGTAAHSTVGLGDLDSAEVFGTFRLGRRPRRVGAERQGQTLLAHHDGYGHLGLIHWRRLQLSDDGGGLIGEDRLVGRPPAARAVMRARFHLHPDVVAVARGDAVLITPPSGRAWRLSAGQPARLEPSVYAPAFNVMRRTRQIVIETSLGPGGGRLDWRLARL